MCHFKQCMAFLLLLASSPGWATTKPTTLREVATGVWGFDVDGARCSDNPHMLTFSADGSEMVLQYSKSLDGNPPTRAEYKVLGEGKDYLRMEKVGEVEKTASGAVVQWDLLLLSFDSYCWHRTDWQERGCTVPATRCPEQAKNE